MEEEVKMRDKQTAKSNRTGLESKIKGSGRIDERTERMGEEERNGRMD